MDVVTHIVKFNAQTNGRDKLCRLFQYGSKFGWWFQEEYRSNAELVTKLKNLETHLSATRKVLRFGKSLDLLQGALKALQLNDMVHCVTLALGKINQALYLYVDHILWASKIGLMETDSKKWARIAARFWLVTITFNLLRNIYDIISIIFQERSHRAMQYKKNDQHKVKQGSLIAKCAAENQPVVLDTVKNVTDLFLPLSSLGYIDTSPGFQGIMGIISSIASIIPVWNPKLKLVPS